MRSYRAWFYFVLCFSLTIDIPNDLLRMLRKMECIVQLLCLVLNDWITSSELQHFLENIIISMILQFDTKKYELKLWATRISNDARIQMHIMLYTTYYMSKTWKYSYVSIFAVKAYYWRQWSNMRIAHKRALSFSPNGAHLSKSLCVLNEKETVSVFPPHPHALNNASTIQMQLQLIRMSHFMCVYGKDTKCTMKSERYGCGEKKRPIYFRINFLRKPKRFWILDKFTP